MVLDGEGEYRILLKTPCSDGTSSIQVGLLGLMETERPGVGERPNETIAKRTERLESYEGWGLLFFNHVPIIFCIMLSLRVRPIIESRFC